MGTQVEQWSSGAKWSRMNCSTRKVLMEQEL